MDPDRDALLALLENKAPFSWQNNMMKRLPEIGGLQRVESVEDPRLRQALELLGDDWTRTIRVEPPLKGTPEANGWVGFRSDVIHLNRESPAYKDNRTPILAGLLAHEREHAEGRDEIPAHEREHQVLRKVAPRNDRYAAAYLEAIGRHLEILKRVEARQQAARLNAEKGGT